MALIAQALKVINFLAFLAKHENNFDVPGVACGAPTTPNLLHSLAHHITRFMRAAPYRGGQPRTRKRKASIGKNRISAVIYLPTPLVGSRWCLVGKIIGPLCKASNFRLCCLLGSAAVCQARVTALSALLRLTLAELGKNRPVLVRFC